MTPDDPAADPAPLTPAVFHVLLALSDGPRHGYAVMRQVEDDSGIAMGPGTVYGSLQRLEDAGLVREAEVDEPGDPRRRFFDLTSEGRRALRTEAHRLTRLLRLARDRAILGGEEPA